MATLAIQGDDLLVRLTPTEKVAGLRGDFAIPLSSIDGLHLLEDPVRFAFGLRAPGLSIPGRTRIGTWRGRGRRVYVVARKGKPGIHLRLVGQKLTDLVISTDDAPEDFRKLREALRTEPTIETDIRFGGHGISLAGTLSRPWSPPIAAALILAGSGEVNRDGDHRALRLSVSRDLVDTLAERGLASLRYDKRGIGGSEGTYLVAGLSDNTEDAAAALRELRSRHPGLPIFVIGHSEGGILAERLAARDRDLAGVVLLAAPATTGEVTMRWQTSQVANALPPMARVIVRAFRIDIVAQQQKAVAAIRSTVGDVARIQGRRVNAKWQRELLDYDPLPDLRRITAPVLAITGRKDLQVNPADLETIAAEVPSRVDIHSPQHLTHLLRDDPGQPSLAAYRRLAKQPTDHRLLSLIGSWVVAHVHLANDAEGVTS